MHNMDSYEKYNKCYDLLHLLHVWNVMIMYNPCDFCITLMCNTIDRTFTQKVVKNNNNKYPKIKYGFPCEH